MPHEEKMKETSPQSLELTESQATKFLDMLKELIPNISLDSVTTLDTTITEGCYVLNLPATLDCGVRCVCVTISTTPIYISGVVHATIKSRLVSPPANVAVPTAGKQRTVPGRDC